MLDFLPRAQLTEKEENTPIGTLPLWLSRLLKSRGVATEEEAERFLHPSLDMLYDPFRMQDMDRAVDLIRQAVLEQAPVTVYGDYDCDGVTATAIMVETLREMGGVVDYQIPDRHRDGYGLSRRLIDDIADIDPSYKQLARNKILEKYPEFKFRVSEEKASQPKGMIVTAKKLEEKKAEAEKIQNVELPANAKDVADARAKGDLKENAEYKAAREQQHYLQLTLAKLQEELSRAVVFDSGRGNLTRTTTSSHTCLRSEMHSWIRRSALRSPSPSMTASIILK